MYESHQQWFSLWFVRGLCDDNEWRLAVNYSDYRSRGKLNHSCTLSSIFCCVNREAMDAHVRGWNTTTPFTLKEIHAALCKMTSQVCNTLFSFVNRNIKCEVLHLSICNRKLRKKVARLVYLNKKMWMVFKHYSFHALVSGCLDVAMGLRLFLFPNWSPEFTGEMQNHIFHMLSPANIFISANKNKILIWNLVEMLSLVLRMKSFF